MSGPPSAHVGTVLPRIAPSAACGRRPALLRSSYFNITDTEFIMGKYFLAWLLGVPGIVLVLIYMFFH